MCFGCPKWCVVATWSFAIFVFLGGIAYYITLRSLPKKIGLDDLTSNKNDMEKFEKHNRPERPINTIPLSTTTPFPIFDHKSTDNCIIIKGQRKTNLRAGGFIHTQFQLTCNGTIQGNTTLWPESSFFGLFSGDFTGCVEVYLYGKESQLWASDPHKFATSSKNESNPWSEEVPNVLLSSVKKFAMIHSRC